MGYFKNRVEDKYWILGNPLKIPMKESIFSKFVSMRSCNFTKKWNHPLMLFKDLFDIVQGPTFHEHMF